MHTYQAKENEQATNATEPTSMWLMDFALLPAGELILVANAILNEIDLLCRFA